MIGKKVLESGLLRKFNRNVSKIIVANIFNRSLIGNRDWVGFGRRGAAIYEDCYVYPFPAIRFKENSNELLALKEKEKGDWRKLTMEEKKILYRASFRQTFQEMLAPTGEWKSIMGCTLFFLSLSLWVYYAQRMFLYGPLPESFSEENRARMLRYMLVNRYGHLTGISSKWDYELDNWKK